MEVEFKPLTCPPVFIPPKLLDEVKDRVEKKVSSSLLVVTSKDLWVVLLEIIILSSVYV